MIVDMHTSATEKFRVWHMPSSARFWHRKQQLCMTMRTRVSDHLRAIR